MWDGYINAIKAYKDGELLLPQLRDRLIGDGSDSEVDWAIDEVGYNQFIFYVFIAKKTGELYAGQRYPLGFID